MDASMVSLGTQESVDGFLRVVEYDAPTDPLEAAIEAARTRSEAKHRRENEKERLKRFRLETKRRLANWKEGCVPGSGSAKKKTSNGQEEEEKVGGKPHSAPGDDFEDDTEDEQRENLVLDANLKDTLRLVRDTSKSARANLLSFTHTRKAASLRVDPVDMIAARMKRTAKNMTDDEIYRAAVRAREMAIERELIRGKKSMRQQKEIEADAAKEWAAAQEALARKNRAAAMRDQSRQVEAANLKLAAEHAMRQEKEDVMLQQRRCSNEAVRYIAAMQHQLISRHGEVPSLCACAPRGGKKSSWESCANNCEFYNNPQAYARALHDLMRSYLD